MSQGFSYNSRDNKHFLSIDEIKNKLRRSSIVLTKNDTLQ